jgi:endonuclease-3
MAKRAASSRVKRNLQTGPPPGAPLLKPASSRKALLSDRQRPARVYNLLLKLYPDAACALHYRNAFELLVATILSAQCTDVRVNLVTPDLFRKYPTIESLAAADVSQLEQVVRSTGFYRNKAKAIKGVARIVLEKHGGRVPQTMEELLELPGVARKTANVVLGNAFGKNEGMVVDTHIGRLSLRLGFSKQSDPVKIERDLMERFPRERWTMLAHLLIFHGRGVCVARRPRCGDCALWSDCPQIGVANPAPPADDKAT